MCLVAHLQMKVFKDAFEFSFIYPPECVMNKNTVESLPPGREKIEHCEFGKCYLGLRLRSYKLAGLP